MNTKDALGAIEALQYQMGQSIVGQREVIERLIIGLLANGNLLIEGLPGLAKTRAIKAMAKNLDARFSRIQFTPDLLPSDVTGTEVYHQTTDGNEFRFDPGPIFANIVLADEINRAPAKVQSALLEVMAERQVSLGGTTYKLPAPFLVLATQNPIESEGVYPLPEAQRDRFLMRIPVDYPTARDEHEIVERSTTRWATPEPILSTEDVAGLQQAATEIFVDKAVQDYAIRLVLATRNPSEHGVAIDGLLAYGASPRASIGLVSAGRALALLRGRDHVLPQDVYDIAYDVLNHRLVLSFDAVADGVGVDDVLLEVLTTVVAPRMSTSQLMGSRSSLVG